MSGLWRQYRRKGLAQMRPYVRGEDLSGVSVSAQDDPETDIGMIARNPDNHADQWYVAREYWLKHYEPVYEMADDELDDHISENVEMVAPFCGLWSGNHLLTMEQWLAMYEGILRDVYRLGAADQIK